MSIEAICSVSGCGKPAINFRGWCKRHYIRWWKYGDPQKRFALATGEAARHVDIVMQHQGDACLFWPHSKGRAMMYHHGRHTAVARVVCERRHGPPPTPAHEAAHSCGKGHLGCVSPQHVSWKTPLENAADKHLHGTMARGEGHGRARLTATDVMAIMAAKGRLSQVQIAADFSISNSTVSLIH